jgi:predicted GNAT family N-acyltransferase
VPRIEIKIARGLDDLMMAYAIRAAVYIAEQDCPYREEFDGNDHCATHFLGFFDDEPAGCLRARFFAGFAKLERLAVRKNYRRSTLAFALARAGIAHARRKGYTKVYGHAREGLESFWARAGAKPMSDGKFTFSDYRYTEMLGTYEPAPDGAITLESGPMVLLRPEGEWDCPGILEASSDREPRTPT